MILNLVGTINPDNHSDNVTPDDDAELARCATDLIYWFNNYCVAFDPRLPNPYSKFTLWPKQEEFLLWLQDRERTQTPGLVEKSRDSGVSYLCCGYALHRWLFGSGFAAGFGSRKAEYVDNLGDPKSIFEKIRMLLRGLPTWQHPAGFDWRRHSAEAKLINPANGSTITGESGDGIGRGGRTSIYFVDESAHIERPKLLDSSLSATTNVRIDVSTPNGLNEFYQRRQSGMVQVFRIHWQDDPRKNATEEKPDGSVVYPWYEEQKRKPDFRDPTVLAQEIDIDYVASGNPAFNRAYLFTLLNVVTGSSEYAPVREETPDGSAFNATVRTFFEPEPGVEYLIVADPSEGIDGHGNHDYAVAHVYNCSTWEQACHYRGRPDPASFGLDLSVLGTMYNYATIAVLRNNHGHSVLNTLMNQCKYGRSKGSIYHHQVFDQVTKLSSMRPGYPETPRSKPEAVDALTSVIEAMAEGEEGFYWYEPNTIEELIHYVKLGGAKTGNEPGSHDDEVSCCYLAAVLMPQFTKRGLSGANGVRRVDWDQVQPVMPKTANANSFGAVHGLRTMPQPMSKRRRR